MSLDKHAVYIHVNHILTVHMYVICCNWEIMFSSYYPGRKHIIMKLLLQLSVTTVALVCNCV